MSIEELLIGEMHRADALLLQISKELGAILGDELPPWDAIQWRLEEVGMMLALAGLGRYDGGFYYHGVPSSEEDLAEIRAIYQKRSERARQGGAA